VAVFTELLDRVLHQTPGALSVTLMGFDGIAIETRERDADAAAMVSYSSAAIEIGAITSQLKRVAEGLGVGDVHEVMVQTGEVTTVLRPVTSEYFVALSLSPTGLFGKGRYLLRIVGPQLAAALSE
jgi:predicted regulator of Ras-like GTPase activity (Roadblock/LC7/MglB family)